jgi:hypothetical protein
LDADTTNRESIRDATAKEEHDPPQFTLRVLFLAISLVGAALGLVVWRGIGTLPCSFGLIVSWMNVAGRLEFAQTKKGRPKWFGLAWLLFIVSLFLPAVEGCSGGNIYGWEAAISVMSAEARMVGQIYESEAEDNGAEDSPSEDDILRPTLGFIYYTLINLGNVFMLLLPLFLWRLHRDKGRGLGNVFCFCALSVWLLGWDGGHLLVGYAVWCLSFAAVFVAYRLRWRTFVGLLLYSACILGAMLFA